MENVLNVLDRVVEDTSITRWQEQIILPENGLHYGNSTDIHFLLTVQDLVTLPSKSYIYLEGKLLLRNGNAPTNSKLSNNAFCHLFERATYDLNSKQIDSTRFLGPASTMKNFISLKKSDSELMSIAGWNPNNEATLSRLNANKEFSACIPLSSILGFAEDYKKVIVNASQRLMLRRTMDDRNAYEAIDPAVGHEVCTFKISHISWRVPFISLGAKESAAVARLIHNHAVLQIPFRSWTVFENAKMKQTTSDTWQLSTSSKLEKPRFVIFGFQTARKSVVDKSSSEFDHCNISDVKVYIDNQVFPYINLKTDFTNDQYLILYRMFATFRESYYDEASETPISPNFFKNKAPLICIDTSRQNDSIKDGGVNFSVEFTTHQNFDDNTCCYALIIHDRIVEYNSFDRSQVVILN